MLIFVVNVPVTYAISAFNVLINIKCETVNTCNCQHFPD